MLNLRDIFVNVIWGAWFVTLAIWLISAFSTKRNARMEQISSGITHRLPVVVSYILLFARNMKLGVLDSRFVPETIPWAFAGAVLAVAGLSFSILARFVIGRNWSSAVAVKQDHELIQTGPYRLVRHPIYSGFLLGALGAALGFGELRDFLAVLLIFLAWKIKSLGEERFMLAQFGLQYSDYMRRVKGLIPFVW